jgi:phosphonopyruvate decarboxylase
MIQADSFIEAAGARGFSLYTGVPCSYLTPFINCVIDSSDLRYVGAANEGDAVAIAAGAALGGRRAVCMLQNSGLGNAVNPLTSLTYVFRIPMLLITTLRGEPGGPVDEPQHALMGAITTRMLELMEIPWEYFPRESEAIEGVLDRARAHMEQASRPFALVMQKGAVSPRSLESSPRTAETFDATPAGAHRPATARRSELLRAIQQSVRETDLILVTTGYAGRELWALADRPSQLYMVGSMGCLSSIGLGLALSQPRRRVVAIDGDGAMLMRMGALATIGQERPANLVHVMLDNEMHESTGGQSTAAHSVDSCAVAAACGYPRVRRGTTVEQMERLLAEAESGPSFLHFKVRPGVREGLPRPTIGPADVARRFVRHIRATT